MAQYHFMRQNSTLPSIRMELVEDGGYTYNHNFHECIQAADITFTMTNVDSGVVKVSKSKAYIKLRESDSCEEEYLICYDFKARDTKECGTYEGYFEITFSDDLKSDEHNFPKGVLRMPIREKLYIVVD